MLADEDNLNSVLGQDEGQRLARCGSAGGDRQPQKKQ